MGTVICEAIEADPSLKLVTKVSSDDDLSTILKNGAKVAVDVTNAKVSRHVLPWLAGHGIDAVVGTTGFSPEETTGWNHTFKEQKRRCLIVPNFSIGAVILMRCAEAAAPYFDGVEIIEMHHEAKKDAPSGTARYTAERIAGNRSQPWIKDPTQSEEPEGVRGGVVNGIPVHSVRLPGFLASEEVIFGASGQTFSLRHNSLNRSAFMPGVVLAIKSISRLKPGVTTGLDAVLDLK